MSFQDILIIPRYFTLWTWIFFFLFPNSPMNLINSMISSVGGFYITYIYPKFLELPFFNIKINGPVLWIVDIFTHQSLFFYQLSQHKDVFHYPTQTLLQYHMLFIVYFFTCFNPKNYGLRWNDIYYILGSYTIIFLILQRVI